MRSFTSSFRNGFSGSSKTEEKNPGESFFETEKKAHALISKVSIVEAEKLVELRALLDEENLTEFSDDVFISRLKNESSLLVRYLREHKTVKRALEKIIETLQWRTEHNVKEAIQVESDSGWKIEYYDEIKIAHPGTWHGRDKLGRPIYIDQVGISDVLKCIEYEQHQEVPQSSAIVSTEFLTKVIMPQSDQEGDIKLASCIFDASGLNAGHMRPTVLEYFSSAAYLARSYYPSTVGVIYLVNTPWIFRTVFELLKPFLGEDIPQRIRILGSDFKERLAEIIDMDTLPKIYGGNCVCEGGCMFGHSDELKLRSMVTDCSN